MLNPNCRLIAVRAVFDNKRVARPLDAMNGDVSQETASDNRSVGLEDASSDNDALGSNLASNRKKRRLQLIVCKPHVFGELKEGAQVKLDRH
jgi:hypothetical protein